MVENGSVTCMYESGESELKPTEISKLAIGRHLKTTKIKTAKSHVEEYGYKARKRTLVIQWQRLHLGRKKDYFSWYAFLFSHGIAFVPIFLNDRWCNAIMAHCSRKSPKRMTNKMMVVYLV